MTFKNKSRFSGVPAPITELTYEQDLKMRLLEDRLNSGEVDMKDFITVFLALQKQNFVLSNSLINLLEKWPNEEVLLIRTGKGI